MGKSIYSLVLSDEVVEEVDMMAQSSGLSRSAMINSILAERVACTTAEMRLRDILQAAEQAMNSCFALSPSTASTLSARSSLKYRYKPTVHYSVEFFPRDGRRAGEFRVSSRTRNEELIGGLNRFYLFWVSLERKYISAHLINELAFSAVDGKFTRELDLPGDAISDNALGKAVAEYVGMFDGTMKAYFSGLPDEAIAHCYAENYYREAIARQSIIL